MRVFCIFLLYAVGIRSWNGIDSETEIQLHRKQLLEKLREPHTVILDGYHLVTRQVATDVRPYRISRSVNIVFYAIMREVAIARFSFLAEELHMNAIGFCKPQHVIINLKRGSYPAVNPDGFPFPKNFIDPLAREHIHTIELLSDGKNRTYTIENPKPGNWFAIVYIKWEDPNTQQVQQQGLVPNCNTILYTDLQVKKADEIELIDCYSGALVDYTDLPAYFKCITIDSTDSISFNLTVVNTTTNVSKIHFKLQTLTAPTDEDNLVSCVFDPKLNNILIVTFAPHPNAWHYIHIDYAEGNTSLIADCESYYLRTEEEDNNHTVLDLMRDDKGRFFTFDYGLPTTDIHDATSLVNLTSKEITTVRFKVNQFMDIGGTLTIEASLLMSLKYYMGYRRQIKKGALLAFTEDNQFFRSVICMTLDYASVPLETGHCKYNDHVKPALFVLNSTDSESIYDKVIIPFPESGTWYLTFRLFCDEVVCPCRTSHNGTKYYVESEQDEVGLEGENISGELSNNTREGKTNCNATVVLSISSAMCVGGKCENHGICQLNTIGAMVMSWCYCTSGYGGWDCSDASRIDSLAYMLGSVLLLTLSNLLFFLSIYVAIIRLYYTEAMMYAFAMIFSTFYHACDAPQQVAFCIIKGNILQFADFYCGIMSFWVTLLAMGIMGEKMRSSLQLGGAIMIALLTTWNMHNIAAFASPVALGVAILFTSWYVDYRKTRTMRYPRTYYTRYLPAGIVLVAIGLICYAFLQTQQNYKIVHSVWHIIVATCVVFLLPDVKRDAKYNPFLPSPGYCQLSFCRIFKRSQTPVAN